MKCLFKFLFIFLFSFSISSCYRKVVHIADTKSTVYRVDKKLRESDAQADALIAPYKKKLDEQMEINIAVCEAELSKGKPNSTLTNWFADAFMDGSQAVSKEKLDFSVSNYGGIRINALAKGDVTIGKIYEVMPFDNQLAIAEADSAGVHKLCNRIARYGGWPISKQLSFEIKDSAAIKILIDNTPLNNRRAYRFALPDYVANGGDDCFFLKEYKITILPNLIRDLLIEDVKRKKVIQENNQQRIKVTHQ